MRSGFGLATGIFPDGKVRRILGPFAPAGYALSMPNVYIVLHASCEPAAYSSVLFGGKLSVSPIRPLAP